MPSVCGKVGASMNCAERGGLHAVGPWFDYGLVHGDLPVAARTDVPTQAVAHCSFATGRSNDFISGATGHDIASRGLGGGRGAYRQVDGDLPTAAAGTDAPAPAVAHRCHSNRCQSGCTHDAGMLPEHHRVGENSDPADPTSISMTHCNTFDILHVNIRGLLSHVAELTARLRLMEVKPVLLCINETFLDPSVEEVDVEGYTIVARRDRCNGQKCGGVAVYALASRANHVTFLERSADSERVWVLLHTHTGPLLACTWYRPPCPGEVDSIGSLKKEWQRLNVQAVGTILVGDANVHNRRWLRYSAHNSPEGSALYNFCAENGLRQIVRGPTRGEYLLDLAMTDMESTTAKVVAKIADHAMVMVSVKMELPLVCEHTRSVWDYGRADWDGLKSCLGRWKWAYIHEESADVCAEQFTADVLSAAAQYIPKRIIKCRKSTHPWLNDHVLDLVESKKQAWGTDHEKQAQTECSQGILEAYHTHTGKVREELLCAKRGSKKWWTKSRELLQQKAKISSIPALKDQGGEWIHDAEAKANLFANTFKDKFKLPDKQENEYSEIPRSCGLQKTPKAPSTKYVEKVIEHLDDCSSTGPDQLGVRILKECAKEIAGPLRKIVERILATGQWPSLWRQHWVVPIYKRKAVFLPANYRGVHLTSQLSKVVERLLLADLTPHITSSGCFGENHFAYTKKRGARDALAFLVLTWIAAADRGMKIGIYCSDVSGAFDRVCSSRLLAKLRARGVHQKLIDIIASWLQTRSAAVIVGGQRSTSFDIKNMVYQGTVLGPTLWNMFFADACDAIREYLFEEVVFADDLNAFREFGSGTPNEEIFVAVDKCQDELHAWGRANQVSFDPAKESKHVMSRRDPCGDNFKLLGVVFDCRLFMDVAIQEVLNAIVWKTKMILRARRFYCITEMINQYKAHILSYVEYRTAAIYHATTTLLCRLDRAQDRFLKEIGVDPRTALLEYGLAPLSMRRDIAMLGMLHRAALGEGPPQLRQMFRRRPGSWLLADPYQDVTRSPLIRRSAWGLIPVYNRLGSGAQNIQTVKDLQFYLQERVKKLINSGLVEDWQSSYSPR